MLLSKIRFFASQINNKLLYFPHRHAGCFVYKIIILSPIFETSYDEFMIISSL